MEKFPVDSGNGQRLASLIEHRLQGDQHLYLVSVGSTESASNTQRRQARDGLLALLDEMRRNVSASGASEAEVGKAIDESIADVRGSNR